MAVGTSVGAGGRAPPRPPCRCRNWARPASEKDEAAASSPATSHSQVIASGSGKLSKATSRPDGPPASWREPTPKVTRIRTAREKTIARARMAVPSARKSYTGTGGRGRGKGEGEGARSPSIGRFWRTSMPVATSPRRRFTGYALVTAALLVLATAFAARPMLGGSAAGQSSLLSGRVTSAAGEALAGIPVKAHRVDTSVAVAVYSNTRGEYSFPEWSDVTPGTYAVTVELPDFEHVKKEPVSVIAGTPTSLDITLRSRQPSVEDATASEIVAALPGTDLAEGALHAVQQLSHAAAGPARSRERRRNGRRSSSA